MKLVVNNKEYDIVSFSERYLVGLDSPFSQVNFTFDGDLDYPSITSEIYN